MDAKGKFVGRYECFEMSVVWVLYRVQEGYVTLEWVSIYIYIVFGFGW